MQQIEGAFEPKCRDSNQAQVRKVRQSDYGKYFVNLEHSNEGCNVQRVTTQLNVQLVVSTQVKSLHWAMEVMIHISRQSRNSSPGWRKYLILRDE